LKVDFFGKTGFMVA